MTGWWAALWLLLWPNAALPGTATTGGMSGVTANGPVVVTPPVGEEAARAQKLPYLLAIQTTDFYHASPSQAENIALVARRLNGVVVPPGAIFSYYRVVGPYTAENGYGWGRAFVGDRIVPSIGGGVCQGASTLYAAVLRTGMRVVERHPHGLTVPYLPPGEDATVSSDYLNFRFQNTFSTPVLIAARTEGRHLTIALWGGQPGPQIEVKHEILERYPFRTIVRVNARLKPGTEKVLAPGQEGVKVRSWLEIHTPHGIETKSLGIDRYRPSPRIVERGPTPPSP
ncbi:MAG: VanW family protein [Firmicutes bacterium]|nr:VanW family protein [Alicyclobacillaceae bacterium]MCL6496546.1 VanW family protein [Bacillota bacterium]